MLEATTFIVRRSIFVVSLGVRSFLDGGGGRMQAAGPVALWRGGMFSFARLLFLLKYMSEAR